MKFLRYIALVAEKFDPAYLFRPNLRDENDNMFIELAVASESRYLITQNVRDFASGELHFKSYEIVTPAEFMHRWRHHYG